MKNFFCFCTCFLFLYSCHNTPSPHEIILLADDISTENNDSANTILGNIIFPEELDGKDKADYWRIKTLAHAGDQVSLEDDSLILYSLDYYMTNDIKEHIPITLMLSSLYSQWSGDFELKINCLERGLEWAKENNEIKLASQIHFELATSYLNNKNYDKAIDEYHKALSLPNGLSKHRVFYDMGITYAIMGEQDSTDHYMKKCIDIAIERNRMDDAYFYLRNYAEMLMGQKRNREALRQLEKLSSVRYNLSGSDYISMAANYLLLDEYDLCEKYLNLAADNIPSDSRYSLNLVLAIRTALKFTTKHELHLRDIGQYNDSIWESYTREVSRVEAGIIQRTELEQQKLMLTVRKQQVQLIVAGLLILIVISSVVAFIYIRNKKQKLFDAQERMEALESMLGSTLKSDASSKDNFFRNVLLQQLGLIRLVATAPTTQKQELLRQMSLITNHEIAVDNLLVWEDLYNIIDSIYDNFYTRVKNCYGDILNEKEIQLCCLLCAEFSTKEISVVTQQSVRTIYQRKTTIRQKLGMDEKDDIIAFINSNSKV